MALEMRGSCERSQAKLPSDSAEAYICSYECTWCGVCAATLRHVCPNCGDELMMRPRRKKA